MTTQINILILLALSFVSCHQVFSSVLQQTPVDSSGYYYQKVLKSDSKTDLLQAFVFYRTKKEESLKASDTLHAIYSLRQLAIIQKKLGVLYDSETSAIEALHLVENLPLTQGNKESRTGIYNHLGRVYSEMQDYANAIFYYEKALALAESKIQELVLRNNIAYAQFKQNHLDLAQQAFAAIYKEGQILNDSVILARSLNNLGMVKGKLQDKSAVLDLKKALDIRLALGTNSDILGSYHDLSEYYKEAGNLEEARYYAEEAYKLAQKSKNPNEMLHALSLVIGLKDDAEVLVYDAMIDSIQTANWLVEGKYASKKYALEKQEALAAERLLELEKEKLFKYFYGFLALLALGIGVTVVVFQKHQHQKRQQIEVYNTELRISKKVHDEVANEVYHIMNKLQHEDVANEAILDHLEAVYNKTRDISREHQEINVEEDFQDVLADLIMYYENKEVNIITKDISKVDWKLLKTNKKVAIYRVLQELLTNMKKHSQASLVVLSFKQNGHKIYIDYKDNGVGCQLKIQNGLQNTENRIQTIKGSIIFQSEINEGFQAGIII
ncbi:tetratricopeptide repeat-containing sensor histidine kinase [Xanthomarina sp.]|uniref:tetratricopeptide repeat-containing sensor histidine kinase n=1 Tax=Xanthomarina sp. TaxID=1931211 RepID=UPI002D04DABC|nr:tetratricopeptide repeat protein [Xanthomarina sp.]HLV39963.1 tetratricopeptide repeat protein [Xanthomarina sp.]